MTRKETIKWLESLNAEIGKAEHRTLWHYAEAIDMAINTLKENELLKDENSFLKQVLKMLHETGELFMMANASMFPFDARI